MFIERTNPKGPAKQRKPIFGVGINDAPYLITSKDKYGKTHKCPYYSVWVGILERCYSAAFHKRRPTYAGCTLAEEWKTFSNFRRWMETQDWQGKEIDKDLLSWDTKQYGPESCLFISHAVNNLLTLRRNDRGQYPLGVSRTVINNHTYFVASCSFYGKQKRLGYFKTPEDAAEKYREAKLEYIKQLASDEKDPRIKQALLNLY